MISETNVYEFVKHCEREVESGLTVGVQYYVSSHGRVLANNGYGVAAPGVCYTQDTVSQTFCLTKPFLAVFLGTLVDRSVIQFDQEIEVGASQERVSVEQLLNHSAGLHDPDAAVLMFSSSSEREALLANVGVKPNWNVGSQFAYSEYVSWWLLLNLVTSVLRCDAIDYLDQMVLPTWGLKRSFYRCASEDNRDLREYLATYFWVDGKRKTPLLHQRLSKYLMDRAFGAVGAFTNAQELGHWYESIGEVLDGRAVAGFPRKETLQRLVSASRHGYDERLERECSFGLGFMTDLSSHCFGELLSAAAFGHSGYLGTSFGLYDPERKLAVSVICNTMGPRPFEGAEMFRTELLERLLAGPSV